MYSLRVDNRYRCIVAKPDNSNSLMLLKVGSHDEAYRWAEQRRVALNLTTNRIQVFQVVTVEEPVFAGKASTVDKTSRLFDDISSDEILRLGVPAEMEQYVRAMRNVAELESAKDKLPADAFEGLSFLAGGFPVDEVIEMLNAEVVSLVCDGLTASEVPQGFYVISGEKDLEAILNAPLEKWRVFLHPVQRDLVECRFNGPARVLGMAGTGKTVVALHRTKHLAQSDEAALRNGRKSILLTTFTKTESESTPIPLTTFTPPSDGLRLRASWPPRTRRGSCSPGPCVSSLGCTPPRCTRRCRARPRLACRRSGRARTPTSRCP